MVDVWQRNNTRSWSKQRQYDFEKWGVRGHRGERERGDQRMLLRGHASIIPLAARAPERPGSSDRIRVALQKVDPVALR